ncbi:hypothetical protein F4778DRAFT_59146 [Xylariomycetidae sp. FL2044]|nr:hypothetical protein F4778DRAFT_59146 [Xylariomycetidae sp. FL2044]
MTIPSKDICDACLDSYFRTYEPMFRILHEPSFRYRYQKYWEHPGIQSNGFMMQFVMVLAIGAVFLPQRLQSNLIRNFARDWAYACQWWLIGPTEREAMNIEGVQAFCLLILARQTNAVGGPSSIATDALLKLSFTIGLHLDPRTSSGLSDFQSDMRRRLWATVLELTAITSMQSTLPLLIPRDFQCRPPANIPDHDLKPDHIPDIYSSDTGSPGIDCSLQLLLLKSLPHRIQVIRQLNNVHESRSYEEALNASKTLNAHCREIHSFFHSRAETSEQLDFCSEFHQKFIDSYMRRLALFIVQPFAARAHKDSRFFEARKIRLESSLILASHTESLNLPAETLDDFSRMSMRGSGMFKVGLSQDVISAIGVEIITQINEETASADADNVTSTPQDPLAQLLKAKREPLIRTLEHIREQWQQIIALGRPSLKQYMFLTGMLARIKATEAGQEEGREMVPQAMTDRLKECITLLRESENLSPATNWTTSIETPSLASDPMGFFGFDFSGVDPSLCLDMPDWLPTNDNFAPSSLL